MPQTNKRYISDIDIKLAEFDAIHPLSDSQKAEIAKYRKISRLRDKKTPFAKETITFWEKF